MAEHVRAQAAFLETELKPCLDAAVAGEGHVLFVDAAHFVFGTFLCCLWSFARIFLRAASGRQRFNVLGAWDAVTQRLIAAADLERNPYLRGLGVEPLSAQLSAAYLARRAHGKKVAMKALLMDQRIIAGLGNIYVCEALHRSRLSPRRRASTIATRTGAPNARAAALVDAIKAVLNDAIKAGGSSLRNHRQTDGELGYFQHHFRVYDREDQPCVTPRCRGKVKRIAQSGRSTFFCPVCQR